MSLPRQQAKGGGVGSCALSPQHCVEAQHNPEAAGALCVRVSQDGRQEEPKEEEAADGRALQASVPPLEASDCLTESGTRPGREEAVEWSEATSGFGAPDRGACKREAADKLHHALQ